MIVERQVRPHRDVVPGHEPQPWHIELLVVVIQAAAVPRRIVGRALDHLAAGLDRHRALENPARAVDVLDDVLRRQMPERLGPVHRRRVLGEVECFRGADQILLRRVGRKHRPHLVLLAVEPGDEQHLHRAAAVPVALLPVAADLADTGAKPLHVHRRKSRMAERGHGRLPLRGRRAPRGAELAVRPRLLRQVLDRFVAVGDRRAEDVVVAFREKVAALVLSDVGVALLDRLDDARHVGGHAVAHVPEIEVVGGLDEDNRHLGRCVLRTVDVGGQAHAVLHRNHHAPFDDGDVLEFRFEILAALLLCRCERALLR